MNEAARSRMIRARAELVLGHPFFAALALRLPLAEDTRCRCAWTDGRRLAYNPSRVRSLPLEQVVGVLGHEVLHVACGHHLRRQGRDEHLWNTACDHAINWICLDAGLELPDGYVDDPELRNLPVEEIYTRLLSRKGEEEHGGAQSSSEGESVDADDDARAAGEQSETGDDEHASGESDEERMTDGDESDGDGEGTDQPLESDGDDARGHDSAGTGEVRDAAEDDGAGGDPRDTLQDELHQMLVQAEMAVRDMGDLPAGIKNILGNALRPPLPWKELLARFIETNARNDYSWIPPNRRYLHMGLHLPELRTMELPDIAVAIDTSGSVRRAELEAFSAELSAILEDFDTTVHLIHCDADVSHHEMLTRADLPLRITARGGGGTDFRPVFGHVEEHELAPACLVYLSDMECNKYPETPPYPVLWVCTRSIEGVPPFGELITMQPAMEKNA